jgi:hypothetical protein
MATASYYSYGHGQLAQSVEQRPEKPRVRSSILRLPTIFSLFSIVPEKILIAAGITGFSNE